ncbi:hypothetical protein POM88_049324 [Heracleum sosnowskyi]|uniref:TFIIS N-terminal domain-containing protein n=1 Tax=Heracleum sosnowskyi TaxID=360622 RepID=A0AAD8GY08_9APIA|nr:hypothetical protein POM88_049324 [Heracleum sosnowskyi]
MFMSRYEEDTTCNRRMAKELVDNWSRSIFNKNTRFADMRNFDNERILFQGLLGNVPRAFRKRQLQVLRILLIGFLILHHISKDFKIIFMLAYLFHLLAVAEALLLLTNGFKLLKVGGYLVYNTCSLTVAQNEDVVEQFFLQNSSTGSLEVELEAKVKKKVQDNMMLLKKLAEANPG